jgi:hypothetical protein
LKYPFLQQTFYWLLSFILLTIIYGTAYGSYVLGAEVILLHLPVHMGYFYLITKWVLPKFFFKEKYIQTFVVILLLIPSIAIIYRLTEIFITNPLVYQFYHDHGNPIEWSSLQLPWYEQLTLPTDFANALERTNTVVWICVTIRLFILWQERKQSILQAELNFLKGQLHPHFLFNSLNNLYALSLAQAPQTPDIILGLSNMLRYVLYDCTAEKVPLKKDIEALMNYIELERLRYEDRLELNVNMSPKLGEEEIAPLLMLPLVENAFKHGAAEATDTPWINIELYLKDKELSFKVSNSKPDQIQKHTQKGEIGLLNLRKRLDLLYPGQHTFDYFDESDCFIAELTVQLEKP